MSRIRSIHPEQWTDEEFVSCSPLARLLAIALRNEADDRGVFEWKPIALKMRLLPADDCDIAALLEELVSSNQVIRFTSGGRNYGAIRNFTKFQKPKSPKYRHPEPPGFPQNEEIAAQMEDGGGEEREREGKEEEGGGEPQPLVIDDEMIGWAQENAPLVAERSTLEAELGKYRDWKQASGRQHKNARAGFRNWLRKANEFAAERSAKGIPKRPAGSEPMTYVEPWPQRLKAWRDGFRWNEPQWGPPPGNPGCRVPPHLLAT